MNKTKKWLTVLLASVMGAGIIGFAACNNDDTPVTPPDDTTVTPPDNTNNEVTDKTVTFYDGETVYKTATGKPGDAIDALTLPSKTGYTFSGWKTEGGEEFIPDKIPSADAKIYSSYTANSYKIVLDPNDGSGLPVTLDAVYDAEVAIPEVNFVKGNGYVYSLTGWSTVHDGDAEYLLRASVKNLTAVANETVTLYAQYTEAAHEGDYIISDNVLAAYTGSDAVITLPEECTVIADGAFMGNKSLKEVVIPECYTEIGFGAFEGCDNLEKITVPFIGGSLTENNFLAYIFGAANYRDNTFAYNLTGIGTGDSSIDESSLTGSFYIPRSLRIVVISTAIEEIPEGAFYYAYGLEKVIAYRFANVSGGEYSYRIKKVGDSAFEGCHKLGNDEAANVEYYMPWLAGVEEFGNRSFKGYVAENDYFTSNLFTLGELTNVRIVGEEAFQYNSKMCDFSFGDKLERIGKLAFANINLLQRITIPDSCTYIGESAFRECLYLASVTIGSGVETIEEYAFAYSAALTEVFFKDGLPEHLASNAFYGINLDADIDRLLTDVNAGTVFYFDTQAKATAAETVLKAQYPTISTGVTKPERGPFYYMGQTYEFTMTFSGGHTVIIGDPLYRIGFGLPELVGTYERIEDGVWYDAEIYNITLMLDIVFRAKIDYYLSAKYTHYYIYRVETFTFDEVREDITAFKVGNKETDEWYLEENEYGQIGLWHYGEMVPLDTENGATYCVGGISQFYEDRTMRTLMYRQGNEYFESVLEYNFTYVPKEGTKDDLLTYYGTLYLDEKEDRFLYGTYESGDKDYGVYVDEVVKKIKITNGDDVLVDGTYTTEDEYGDKKLTLTATDKNGGTVTVYFTDFLDDIVDGNILRSLYARCNFTVDGEKHVLYNTKHASYTESYYISSSGKLSNDYYILIQYHQIVEVDIGDDSYQYEVFPGFGEHMYSVSGQDYHDYLTYNYTEDASGLIYQFVIDEGEPNPDRSPIYAPEEEGDAVPDYTGKVIDEFVGTFEAEVANTGVARKYSPYFEDEDNKTFSDGNISITLSGYGTAIYEDEEGNEIKGKYNVVDGSTVMQVYVESNMYYNLVEYVFKSDDGAIELFFVPNFFDSYDGSMKEGEMYLPDSSRERTYRVFDEDGWCTGQFSSMGYGMGILFIMINSDAERTEYSTVTSIDNTFFCPGATYAYYTEVGEKDGKPLYRLETGLGKGFFTFQFTNRLSLGHRFDNMSRSYAFELDVSSEYNTWWKDVAARYITGDISPDEDEMTRMVAREEIGVYTSPNGYTLELDGKGTATLKKPDGTLIHTATYKSVDENRLGIKKYPFIYTVGETTYEGVIDIIDAQKRDNALIILELTVDGVVLNHFARGTVENYTAAGGTEDFGTLTVYAGENVGEHKVVDGKDVYNLGSYEVDEETGNYIFRFDDKKLIVSVSGNTYTIVHAYQAIQVYSGEYYCTAYYKWSETEGKIDKDGNELLDEEGNIIPYPKTTLYGFDVRAEVVGSITRPVSNPNSEYVRTSINAKYEKDEFLYFYGGVAYKADMICYEDGEFIISYDHLDIIRIESRGKYLAADDPENDMHKALIVLDKGNAICVYMEGDVAVG